MRLIDEPTGRVVVAALEVADTFWSRLVGLQFRKHFPADSGLLIVPCGSVHTCFLRFAIDLVFLDRAGKVLGVKPRVRPWRIAFAPRGTFAILELAGGGAEPVTPGGRLLLAPGPDADRPWLRFLSRFD